MPKEGDIQRNTRTGEMRIWTGSTWGRYDGPVRPDPVSAPHAALISLGETLARWGSRVGLAEAPDESLTRHLRADHPVATAVGAAAPSVVASFLPGGFATQTAIGGATGALDNGVPGALQGAALSGAGSLLGSVIGRGVNAARGVPALAAQTDESARLLARGAEMGFSPMPHRAASVARNAKRMNSIAARSMGVNATELSPAVMNMANRRFKSLFDAVGNMAGDGFALGSSVDDLAEAGVEARHLAGLDLDNMSGGSLMKLRTQLVKSVSTQARNRGGQVMDKASDLIDHIDDMIGRRLSPAEMQDWSILREQFRNYVALNSGKSVVDARGNVVPSGLVGKLQTKWGDAFKHGGGGVLPETRDMFDAARVMTSGEFIPASTAGLPSSLASGIGTGLIGAAQSMYSGGSMQDHARNAALYGAAGYLLPRAAVELRAAKSMPVLEQILAGAGRTGAAYYSERERLSDAEVMIDEEPR